MRFISLMSPTTLYETVNKDEKDGFRGHTCETGHCFKVCNVPKTWPLIHNYNNRNQLHIRSFQVIILASSRGSVIRLFLVFFGSLSRSGGGSDKDEGTKLMQHSLFHWDQRRWKGWCWGLTARKLVEMFRIDKYLKVVAVVVVVVVLSIRTTIMYSRLFKDLFCHIPWYSSGLKSAFNAKFILPTENAPGSAAVWLSILPSVRRLLFLRRFKDQKDEGDPRDQMH